jgi:hypothetical protein
MKIEVKKELLCGLLVMMSARGSSREEFVSHSASSSSSRAPSQLETTTNLIAAARALAVSSNVRPGLTDHVVSRLLAKRAEKLAFLNEVTDKLEVLNTLQKTLESLIAKNSQEADKADRNKAFQEDELKKMRDSFRKLILPHIILLELSEDEFAGSSSQDDFFSYEDNHSQASGGAMSSEEAIVRDRRNIAKIIEPQSLSKQKIIDGFKAYAEDLDAANDKLLEKLEITRSDLARAQQEFIEAEKALSEVEKVTLSLHSSHPEVLSPEVAATIQRSQDASMARHSAQEGSTCLLL